MMRRAVWIRVWAGWLWFGGISVVLAAPPAAELAILPGEFTLSGTAARQRLLVEEVRQGRYVGEAEGTLRFQSTNPKVVSVENGFAVPVGNGSAEIVVTDGTRTAKAKVKVVDQEKPFEWSFRNHVQSVLAKAGCNSGACHGAQAGKKGLKLSLRGYDAEGDYYVLTHQARGRRVVLAEPAKSLILTKPTATLKHGGGKRFDVGSLDYQVISDWIAAGAPPPRKEDPRIERIEILPPATVLQRGQTQQLLVHAYFSDGHVEDVTRWVKYDSANAEVVQVDADGKATVMGLGEGAVTAWYLNKLVIASVTVPYDQQVPTEVFTKAERRNFIDELVLEKLEALNLPPSTRCSDSEFIRRVFLDAIGTLPTADEVRTFLADTRHDKRDRLIDSLFARPEFVDYWTYKFSDLLLVNSERLARPAMWAYYHWIRANVAANTPWDAFVRRLVTAQGSTLENGAANFFVLHQDPLELNETISQAFLGMSINCARCHNHPLEKWTNDEYYGMVNLLARVRLKDRGGDGNMVVFAAPEGEIVQPLTGEARPPRPLDGEPLPHHASGDRRVYLAEWLTADDNPYFARAISNRIWANFLNTGLVESVDDLRLTNPASNEKLLSALARHLKEQKYDLRQLMRTIMRSATYQRSSLAMNGNGADRRFYARYYPKRLMAEVMIDAISQATGVPTDYRGVTHDNPGPAELNTYPTGWRAIQLPDSKVNSYFLRRFGRPERDITCECERTNEPNMVQVLHLSNGDAINKKLEAHNSRLSQWIQQKLSDEQILDEAYLTCLARFPTPQERQKLLAVLKGTPPAERRVALEDVLWSILSSKEFLFNH